MALVRDWRRQAARAAGASLIFPVALFAVAALVAAGGGLGGLGSLGQVTSGPELPATAAPAAGRSASVESAGIVAIDPSPVRTGPRSTASNPAGGGAPTGGGSPGTGVGGRTPAGTQAPAANQAPVSPLAGGSPTTPAPTTGGGNTGGGGNGTAPQAPDPVQQIIEDPRGIGRSLPAPLGPTTGRILDPLLGNTAP